MSTPNYLNSPDVQAYLDLTDTIQYGGGGSSPSYAYFASANFAFTTLLATKMVPSSMRLSTINSYAAYYAIGFMAEVLSEILTRSGNETTAAYFGNDPANFNADFGDSWYHDLGESLIDATVDTFMGFANLIDTAASMIQNPGEIATTLSTMLEGAFGGQPGLSYDSMERNGLGFTFTYRGGSGNDYFDLADRELSHPTIAGYDQLIVYGGGGRDLIANVNVAHGQDGDDQIQYVDTAWGNHGNDYILHVETAYGGRGDDYIVHVDGDAYGGDDKDFIEKVQQTAYGEEGDDVLVNNNVSRGGDGNDYIVGSNTNYRGNRSNILDGGNGDDYLEGRSRNDKLTGGAGNDILIGGGGNDTLQGGSGDDLAVMRGDRNFTVHRLENDNYDYRITGQGTDRIRNIETVLIQGGQGNNTVDATELEIASNLDGLAGNDMLKGGSEGDFIFGGLGNDTLRGNGGDDVLVGGDGIDTAVYAGNAADYSIATTRLDGEEVLTVSSQASGTDYLDGIEQLQFADQTIDASLFVPITLNGTAGNDELTGTVGRDIINGLAGNDRMRGRKGNDVLNGGAGNDNIQGGEGDDLINGGTGIDGLYGGLGADVFLFNNFFDTAHDFIHDFEAGVDQIVIFKHLYGIRDYSDITVTEATGWSNMEMRFGQTYISFSNAPAGFSLESDVTLI